MSETHKKSTPNRPDKMLGVTRKQFSWVQETWLSKFPPFLHKILDEARETHTHTPRKGGK